MGSIDDYLDIQPEEEELVESGDVEFEELNTQDDRNAKVKRKVVGRVVIKRPYLPGQVQREPPRDVGIPIVNQEFYPTQPMFYPNQQQYFQQREQAPTEHDIKERIRADIMYQQMMQEEMYKMQMANRPKQTIGQKLVSVAHKAAMGDNGMGANISLKTKLYRDPHIELPSQSIKRNSIKNINDVVHSIAPKIVPKKKKSGKGGFWA